MNSTKLWLRLSPAQLDALGLEKRGSIERFTFAFDSIFTGPWHLAKSRRFEAEDFLSTWFPNSRSLVSGLALHPVFDAG